MTTTFDVLIVHDEPDYARQAANAAFADIQRMEGLLSRHDPGTDLAQVNRLGAGEYMRVNLEVLGCLEIAARAYVETHGAFDPAFRSTAGGTRPSTMDFLMLSRPDSDAPEEPAEYLVGFDPAIAEHGFESAEIDLGGIGKGFALDHAAELLEDWSIGNFLLNSGTSTVLARGGGPEGQGWTVGVSGDYRELTGIHTTDLVNVSLSGSGTAVKGEHIKNPKTGQPAQALAAWAKARSAAWTDAMSTGLMVMEKEPARRLLNQGRVAQGIVVYLDGFEIFGDW